MPLNWWTLKHHVHHIYTYTYIDQTTPVERVQFQRRRRPKGRTGGPGDILGEAPLPYISPNRAKPRNLKTSAGNVRHFTALRGIASYQAI